MDYWSVLREYSPKKPPDYYLHSAPSDAFNVMIQNRGKQLRALASKYIPELAEQEPDEVPQTSRNPWRVENDLSSFRNTRKISNVYGDFERKPFPPAKRTRPDEDSKESKISLDTFVGNTRNQLDFLFSKFKNVCHLDLPESNLTRSQREKNQTNEEFIKSQMAYVSNNYANLLYNGLLDGESISEIDTIAAVVNTPKESITFLQKQLEKICKAVESNGKYNGAGPNLSGTGVARFITCPRGCTCILETSQDKISQCSACESPYNSNVQAMLLSVRELYREKFKNRKVAEVEWLNANRYIENLRAGKTEETPEHVQRMMDDGFFDLDNSSKKDKIIDIPFAVLMDAIPLPETTHLKYSAIGGFNLAENSLQMKSKKNVHPMFIYPKVKLHAPSNKPTNHKTGQSSNSDYDTERVFVENKDSIADNELDVTACGVFQPLVDEFISLSKFEFKVYDDFNKEEITVRIHWLYTIGDMDSVSELIGGRYASNLRCCPRCNIFKTPLYYKDGKYTRSLLSFVHCFCGPEDLNLSTQKSRKNKEGFYNPDNNMDLTNGFYKSEVAPHFNKRTGQISDRLMVSKQRINDLQEPTSKMKRSTHTGFKLKSPIFDLPYFSLPYSLPPDINHTQAIDVLKLLLSVILDPTCEGRYKKSPNERVDISIFLFSKEQMNAYFNFLGLLDEHTPQAFRDGFFKPENQASTSTFWLKSAAQGEALLKSLYLLPHFIPDLTRNQRVLLLLYSQMAVLMMINSSSHIDEDLDLDLVQESWNCLIKYFEIILTDDYNINGFIGTLPLHTMLHTPGYLKTVGPLKTFTSNATERIVKSFEEPQQNIRYPVTELCDYQLKCYAMKLAFMGQSQPEILQPDIYLSGETGECTTEEEKELLELLNKSLVRNYVKYRNANKFYSSSSTSKKTRLNLIYANKMKLEKNASDSNTFYYHRQSEIHWNTSKYTATASSSKSLSTNKLDNFVRVMQAKNSKKSKSPSYYAKLLDCFCVGRDSEAEWDKFAIVEKIPTESLESLVFKENQNIILFGSKVTLGFYWEDEYKKGERVVVPLNRIANPVFIIPQYNIPLSKSEKFDRFFILDPNVFLEFKVKSKVCQLSIVDEHKNVNKEELDYLQKHLKNKDSVVVKR